jgi:hypothetical protein
MKTIIVILHIAGGCHFTSMVYPSRSALLRTTLRRGFPISGNKISKGWKNPNTHDGPGDRCGEHLARRHVKLSTFNNSARERTGEFLPAWSVLINSVVILTGSSEYRRSLSCRYSLQGNLPEERLQFRLKRSNRKKTAV